MAIMYGTYPPNIWKGCHTMKKHKHTLWLPDELWKKIPFDNKTRYITDAIQTAIHMGGNNPSKSHTQNQAIITQLKTQIEDLKEQRDRYQNQAETQSILLMPFWKRWRIRKRLLPQQEEYYDTTKK